MACILPFRFKGSHPLSMKVVRLQTLPSPGATGLRRNRANNRVTHSICLRIRHSPNTGRICWCLNSERRWTSLKTAIPSEDCPSVSPAPTPVPVEGEGDGDGDSTSSKPKAWFYLFAEAALCYLVWSPSETMLRFVFLISSSIALASVESFRMFVREHIHDTCARESHSKVVEGTLTSDCSGTALPCLPLEFRQGPNSVEVIEEEEDKTITLHPQIWFYLSVAAAVCYLMWNPSPTKLLLAFAITSSTALGCVEFFGKFEQKRFHYWTLLVRSRELGGPQSSHCSRTTFPSSSIEYGQGRNPSTKDDQITTCERKLSIQVHLLIPVVCFFLLAPLVIFTQELLPSLVALCSSMWTPTDNILATSFIFFPSLLTVWALSVKHMCGHLHAIERPKEDVKLNLSTKPQQITEAEGTLTTADSWMASPSSFPQDRQVSCPTRKEYKANNFKRILLSLFWLGVPVLCFYFFLVNVLEAMEYGKPLAHPVALFYSLWTRSRVTLRALFPVTSFLAIAIVGFFRIVLQEHLQYMQNDSRILRERRRRKE